jgi:hypothetical protein
VTDSHCSENMPQQKTSFYDRLARFRSLPRPAQIFLLGLTFIVLLLTANHSSAQTMQSPRRQGEIDTTDQPGGQAGGRRQGLQYSFATLRCPDGEAIVGVRIRRGDVLDFMRIACARPDCGDRGCQWTSSYWAMSAGNQSGGDSHPDMLCHHDEMLSGFRALVRTFTAPVALAFDYAADIGIECARITSRSGGQGFFRVSQEPGSRHHPEGGIEREYVPPNVTDNRLTGDISCKPNGGATAISVGIANNFVRLGQRVLQAVSLYCPATRPNTQCPENLIVSRMTDQYGLVRDQWFSRGNRTGGGAVCAMQALPESENWRGRQVRETVRLLSQTCGLNNIDAQNVCGTGRPDPRTGGPRIFTLGTSGTTIEVPMPNNTILWAPWTPSQNSFPDSHFVFAQGDMLGGRGRPQGSCTVICQQTYACGTPPQDVTYGPFTITYTFTRDTYQPVLPGVIPIPTGAQVSVTRIRANKQ